MDKTGHYEGRKGDDFIPLVVKQPAENAPALTAEEKKDQREILMIQTFKRTTVCVTKAGAVYASGDKFAKSIKLEQPIPFGFY